jgi:hypothetical protein
MKTLISLAALICGFWLIYLGYERQQSLAGKADASFSKLGEKIDGNPHPPTHMIYYASGIVLALGGALGLGIVKR